MNAKGLELAQQEKSENVVDIGVRKYDARNRRLAQAFAGMQFAIGFDLAAQVRRRTQKKP
jgi:hypothetical protein